jgi:prenyl protein peptidase
MLSIHILVNTYHATPLETLHLLGWWPVDVLAIVKTLLLCSILFVGPLFEGAIVQERLGTWLRGTKAIDTLSSWTGYRNYIVGPVSEELVFRSFIIPLHIMSNTSPSRIVFLTPLYFGIAHLHHCYEFVQSRPGQPVLQAVIMTLVQFTYTSLFGFFAAFVFLRTGSVYAVVAAHVFCNWMGLPRFWGPLRKIVPPQRTVNPDGSESIQGRHKMVPLAIQWTVAYYALLFAGAFGFYTALWPLTESNSALVTFEAK